MGYGVMAFVVPAFQLEGLRTHNDYRLQSSLEKAGPLLECLALDAYAGDGGISFEDAVRELYAGVFSRADLPLTYRLAFRALCMTWAGWRETEGTGPLVLANDRFMPIRHQFLVDLDEALRGAGVGLAFQKLIHEEPVHLPPFAGDLAVGHWDMGDIERAEGPLVSAIPRVVDADHRAALEQVLGWFGIAKEYDRLNSLRRTSAGRPCVVGFYG